MSKLYQCSNIYMIHFAVVPFYSELALHNIFFIHRMGHNINPIYRNQGLIPRLTKKDLIYEQIKSPAPFWETLEDSLI